MYQPLAWSMTLFRGFKQFSAIANLTLTQHLLEIQVTLNMSKMIGK